MISNRKIMGKPESGFKKKKKKLSFFFFYTNCCYNFKLKKYIMVNSILKFCYSVWFTKKIEEKCTNPLKMCFLNHWYKLYFISLKLPCLYFEGNPFNTKEIISDEWLLLGNWIPYVPLLDTCWRQFVLMKIYPIYRITA